MVICLAGILQAALLSAVIIFYPKSDKSVNFFLAAYVIVFSVPMTGPVIMYFATWHYSVLLRAMLLLSGPTLYLYVISFKETVRLRNVWFHFIPFLFQLAFDIRLIAASLDKYPNSVSPPAEVVADPLTIAMFLFRIAQMGFYVVLCWRALNHYQTAIRHLYSETSRINLSWLRWLINGNFALMMVMLFLYPFVLQNPDRLSFFGLINVCAVIPYLYMATFKGVTQPTLWQIKPGLSHQKVEEEIREVERLENNSVSERKRTVDADKTAEIVSRAIALMENEKIFRTTDLTLQELADRVEFPAYQVSQAINDGLKKNFYDLVNGYRVEEAKRLLLDPKTSNHKIIALAQDAGFNSKTTFNTVFKKFTGYSPSEYRDSQKVVEVA